MTDGEGEAAATGPHSNDQPTAAERWRDELTRWALPDHVIAAAPVSPWGVPAAAFAADDDVDRDTTAARWARDVLPPLGGTVLDVGCGGGRASLPLVPPATELIGVDHRGAMLDEFVEAATRAGVARRTIHGRWPDVAGITPTADVAICHHVVYDVADLAPFLVALTARARLAVVLEAPTRHPMSAWNAGFDHFWQLDRPSGPTADDLIAVVRELGFDPETAIGPRRRQSGWSADPERLVGTARRRWCLTEAHDEEVAAFLAEHPPEFVPDVVTLRWPGAAEPE